MGWVWKDDSDSDSDDYFENNPNYSSSSSGEVCSTRTVVIRSQCKKTEEVLRDCPGK
uniref:Uncharacterized protein n=1 Tax=Populus trichocarpa TaxID=3694 RepID=A0A2K2A538_POPTR